MSEGVIGKLYSSSIDKTVICWDLSKGVKLGRWTMDCGINRIILDVG
jgi:hypothetical protein